MGLSQTAFKKFLPTPSARRATRSSHWGPRSSMISTHALREEGDLAVQRPALGVDAISTHALREEGDGQVAPVGGVHQDFYPRPPRGGRQEGFC